VSRRKNNCQTHTACQLTCAAFKLMNNNRKKHTPTFACLGTRSTSGDGRTRVVHKRGQPTAKLALHHLKSTLQRLQFCQLAGPRRNSDTVSLLQVARCLRSRHSTPWLKALRRRCVCYCERDRNCLKQRFRRSLCHY